MIIREYESTGTLKPDDKGYQAFETAGRRIGPLYNQMAGDVEKAAKDVGQLWEGTVKFPTQELAFLAEEARRLPPSKIVGGRGGGGSSRGADTSSLARYNARNEIGRGGRDISALAQGIVNADTETGVQVFRGGDHGRPVKGPKPGKNGAYGSTDPDAQPDYYGDARAPATTDPFSQGSIGQSTTPDTSGSGVWDFIKQGLQDIGTGGIGLPMPNPDQTPDMTIPAPAATAPIAPLDQPAGDIPQLPAGSIPYVPPSDDDNPNENPF